MIISESELKYAFSHMRMDCHKWASFTDREIDWLQSRIDFSRIEHVYDLGCGRGRHSLRLAELGYQVTGIDFVESNIEHAINQAGLKHLTNVKFLCKDLRNLSYERAADLIICLYDVIGTFTDMQDNIRMVESSFRLLKPEGQAVFSVLNYESAIGQAKHVFRYSKNPERLLELKASDSMEAHGNIFNPDFQLIDEETHIVFRKEIFKDCTSGSLKEFIIPDRRFTGEEIGTICRDSGFVIKDMIYTNASDWNKSYPPKDRRAKEILLICSK